MSIGKRLGLATIVGGTGISIILATDSARRHNAAHMEACRRYSRGGSPPRDLLSENVIAGALAGSVCVLGAGGTAGNELAHRYMSHLPRGRVRLFGMLAYATAVTAGGEGATTLDMMGKYRTDDGVATTTGEMFVAVSSFFNAACLGTLFARGGMGFPIFAGAIITMGDIWIAEALSRLGYIEIENGPMQGQIRLYKFGEASLYLFARGML